ncbi:unnamed protein product [Closterium sp. NIES-64]|nr:unnamed protein product [Closterium sp. NIES-64]
MAISESVGRKIALSYLYVLVWIVLSFSVIVFNKYILDRKLYNWPYPISLTMIHMAFCSLLAFLLVKVFKVVEPISLSTEMYLTSVLPIGALYSLSLWFSNSAYIYLSVSFIQMLKALMLVAVYLLGVLFTREAFLSPNPTALSLNPSNPPTLPSQMLKALMLVAVYLLGVLFTREAFLSPNRTALSLNPSNPPTLPSQMLKALMLVAVYLLGVLFTREAFLSPNPTALSLNPSNPPTLPSQMLKALMPAAVYLLGVLFTQEVFRTSAFANMVAITVGVAVAVYGEASHTGSPPAHRGLLLHSCGSSLPPPFFTQMLKALMPMLKALMPSRSVSPRSALHPRGAFPFTHLPVTPSSPRDPAYTPSSQMLKALMPVAVYLLGVLFTREVFRTSAFANMVAITVGVAVAAYGEANFNVTGVLLQLAAVCFEALRLVLIQILLTAKGVSLNPITSLYYISPVCLLFLSLPWILVEYPRLAPSLTIPAQPALILFLANCACAFSLNLAVFLLIGKTSALTMNVAGVVKDWLLIAFSWSVIRDRVTAINLIGYLLAFVGVCWYNSMKLQELKAKETSRKLQQEQEQNQQGGAGDEESGHLLGGAELTQRELTQNELTERSLESGDSTGKPAG